MRRTKFLCPVIKCYPVTSCARDLGRTAYSITTCQKNFVRYKSSRACNSASTERIWMKKVSYWSQKVGESENATDISSKLKLYLSLQSLLVAVPHGTLDVLSENKCIHTYSPTPFRSRCSFEERQVVSWAPPLPPLLALMAHVRGIQIWISFYSMDCLD